MNKLLLLLVLISISVFTECEDGDSVPPEFYTLDTALSSGQSPKGFSFKDMDLISYPNSKNIIPDIILSVHTNETGDILGPMLSQPDLENRFILIKRFDDLNSAQKYFDTLSVVSKDQYQAFAFDIKPLEIWQIRTNSGEIGNILLLETKTEKVDNTPFAEIKFKAKKTTP